MIITKTFEETIVEESFVHSDAFKSIYLPIGCVIGVGGLVLLVISLVNICQAFSQPPPPRVRRRGEPSPPPTYRAVVRRDRLVRIATITNLRNLTPDVPEVPPAYDQAVEGETPPDYGHINLAFEPPAYEP